MSMYGPAVTDCSQLLKRKKILDQGQTKQEVRTERHLKGKKLKDSLLLHKIRC